MSGRHIERLMLACVCISWPEARVPIASLLIMSCCRSGFTSG